MSGHAVNWRKFKAYEKLHMSAVEKAYHEGGNAVYSRKPRINPYPAGRRHDEWNRGYNLSDPLGDYYGRNY
jgi:hypothetical protein